MAWERGYYYRVRKVGGRVVRQYVGAGVSAELASQLDAMERACREAEKVAWLKEKARLDALDADVSALIDLTDLVAAAALRAAGFHQHKRQWRRKRHGKDQRSDDSDRPGRSEEDPAACAQRG
jgi:hypothetical protein